MRPGGAPQGVSPPRTAGKRETDNFKEQIMSEVMDYKSRVSDPASRKFETFSYLPAMTPDQIKKRYNDLKRLTFFDHQCKHAADCDRLEFAWD